MASTPRTYDVTLRFVESDRRLVEICADRLGTCSLRTRLERAAVETVEAPSRCGSPGPSFRAAVVVVSGRALRQWCEHGDRLTGSDGPERPLLLLAPGTTAAHVGSLDRIPHRAIWDLRDSWDDPLEWLALGRELREFGARQESAIEPRGSLAPEKLKANTIRSYDGIAELFAERWFDHPPVRELETFLRLLPRRSRVLDAGCGPGHHAQMLARAGHDVVGVDLSSGMLRQARKRVALVRFATMDVFDHRPPAASFDAIWSAAMVPHVPREHVPALLLSFKRLLKPGGLLGLNLQIGRCSELVQLKNDHRFFEYYAEARDVARLLNAAGFAVTRYVYGETSRNTHGLDLTLKWGTFYATSSLARNGLESRLGGEDRLA